jgi:hypothetical protein
MAALFAFHILRDATKETPAPADPTININGKP